MEVYQKEYPEKIQAGLRSSEYDTLNEAAECRDDDGDWIDDEDDEAKVKRISSARSRRMKVFRRVRQQCWDDEPDDVKDGIRELAKKEVVPEKKEEDDDGNEPQERTPEEFQA